MNKHEDLTYCRVCGHVMAKNSLKCLNCGDVANTTSAINSSRFFVKSALVIGLIFEILFMLALIALLFDPSI